MPSTLILRTRLIFYLALIGLFPIVLTGAVVGTLLLQGEMSLDEAAVPLMGMSFLSFGIVAIITGIALDASTWEGKSIQQVYQQNWAVLPQFSSVEQWRAYALAEHEREALAYPLPLGMILFLTILFAGITIFVSTIFKELVAFVGLGVMYIIIMSLTVGYPIVTKLQARARYRRRIKQPIPKVYINRDGLYNEDTGYKPFISLQELEYIPPEKVADYHQSVQVGFPSPMSYPNLRMVEGLPLIDEAWGLLSFTALHRERYRKFKVTVLVRIPPDKIDDATTLVQRFQTPKQKRKQKPKMKL